MELRGQLRSQMEFGDEGNAVAGCLALSGLGFFRELTQGVALG